jgi:hypothetical protein
MQTISQTAVEGVVNFALDRVEKPELFTSDPGTVLETWRERYGDEILDLAADRIDDLLALNPRDPVAREAAAFLRSALRD